MKEYLFNIQFFGTAGLNETTDATTGSNDLSPEMQVFYKTQLIEHAKPELYYNKYCDHQNIPKGNGKTIQVRRFTAFPAATDTLEEGVTPTGQDLNVDEYHETLNQYGGYIKQTDLLEMTAVDPIIAEDTELCADQMALTLDTVTRDVAVATLNKVWSPKIVSGVVTPINQRSSMNETCLPTADDFRKIAAILKANNTKKIDGSYIAIVHPHIAADLMKTAPENAWIDVSKYKRPEQIEEGELGKMYGIRFFESSNAKIWNDNTCPVKTAASGSTPATYYSVYRTIVFGKHAYMSTDLEGAGSEIIAKQLGSGGSEDPLNQRSSVGWKATHCAALLASEYMVCLESCSSFSGESEAN